MGSSRAKQLISVDLTLILGVLGDIWAPTQRGTAIVGYAFAVVGGPVLGPIVGGAVVQSYLRWRWTEYLTGIFMLFMLTLDVVGLPQPTISLFKADREHRDIVSVLPCSPRKEKN